MEQAVSKESIIEKLYLGTIFKYGVLIIGAIVAILPVLVVFIGSFKTNDEFLNSGVLALPETWTIENYTRAFVEGDMLVGFKNTLIIFIISMIFYKKALFCGTIREAVNVGYDLDITLSSAENSDVKIGKTQILEMSDRHIIVVREAVPIRPYAEILYTSGDVEVSEDRKEAIPGNSENLSYIIFK